MILVALGNFLVRSIIGRRQLNVLIGVHWDPQFHERRRCEPDIPAVLFTLAGDPNKIVIISALCSTRFLAKVDVSCLASPLR